MSENETGLDNYVVSPNFEAHPLQGRKGSKATATSCFTEQSTCNTSKEHNFRKKGDNLDQIFLHYYDAKIIWRLGKKKVILALLELYLMLQTEKKTYHNFLSVFLSGDLKGIESIYHLCSVTWCL